MPRKRVSGRPARTRPAPARLGPGGLSASDPLEDLYARGLTDGLPVVPPTRERVARALDAAGRPADELIARGPPN